MRLASAAKAGWRRLYRRRNHLSSLLGIGLRQTHRGPAGVRHPLAGNGCHRRMIGLQRGYVIVMALLA